MPEPEVMEEYHFAGQKVLLVDDVEMNREIGQNLLEENGFAVDTAANGLQALNQIQKQGVNFYDVVIMDLQMPLMDGYAATQAVRALPGGKDLPIIALAVDSGEDARKQSFAAGMNGHVVKPIKLKELLDAIQQSLCPLA